MDSHHVIKRFAARAHLQGEPLRSFEKPRRPMSEHRKLPLDTIQRAIRGAVCTTCYQRPHRSELLPNSVARTCESGCPIFLHLPALFRVAVDEDTSAPGALEAAVKNRICSGCHLAPTAGDNCVEFADRTCPLSRFAAEVVTLIETLRQWQHYRSSHD
jgi:hypothetical protein